ncbi:hypothetical protein Ciccas_003827 [Cichlidogyrus casuarinus]|uniref:Uncharacterized protein n=1 Tax=Cichlidogyrus casuarinus TaxID=1844966 RepID=A0ABD2QE30_9PLAT
MVNHTVPSVIERVLKPRAMSSHIYSMLVCDEAQIVLAGLQLAKLLIDRVPQLFSAQFRKEGVFHRINCLLTDRHLVNHLISRLPSSRSLPQTHPHPGSPLVSSPALIEPSILPTVITRSQTHTKRPPSQVRTFIIPSHWGIHSLSKKCPYQ